jgi:hypothetical protein
MFESAKDKQKEEEEEEALVERMTKAGLIELWLPK